jgi:hypothetical protein
MVNGIFKTWTGCALANVELIMISSLDFPIWSQKIKINANQGIFIYYKF